MIEKKNPEKYEALAQVAHRGGRSPGDTQGQIGWGSEQPGVAVGAPVQLQGSWARWSWEVPSNSNDSMIIWSQSFRNADFFCPFNSPENTHSPISELPSILLFWICIGLWAWKETLKNSLKHIPGIFLIDTALLMHCAAVGREPAYFDIQILDLNDWLCVLRK